MKCEQCKHFSGQPGDRYGLCRRYPKNENKSIEDLCGEFGLKIFKTESTYDITTDEFKPKRGRKPKNVD
jgi:hypothetical protein